MSEVKQKYSSMPQTYQECTWKDKSVTVTRIMSNSRKLHNYLIEYIGRTGVVLGEAKNGMLLIDFDNKDIRSIPSSCIVLSSTVKSAKPMKGVWN